MPGKKSEKPSKQPERTRKKATSQSVNEEQSMEKWLEANLPDEKNRDKVKEQIARIRSSPDQNSEGMKVVIQQTLHPERGIETNAPQVGKVPPGRGRGLRQE